MTARILSPLLYPTWIAGLLLLGLWLRFDGFPWEVAL